MAAGDQHLGLGCDWDEPNHLGERFWLAGRSPCGGRHPRRQGVSFLVCGAQKAGTTALAGYLRDHPQLFLPPQKELHHFDDERLAWADQAWARSLNSWLYHRAYRAAPAGRLWGEATPIYMYWQAAPERIWRYNPGMRLIVILRNPIERAYSHWAMEVGRGAESLAFEQAIAEEGQRCRSALPLQHRVYSYLDRGYYSEQLRRLWHLFGRDAVLVLRQEELRYHPRPCLDRVCRHLDVMPLRSVETREQHVGLYRQPMQADTRRQLQQLFAGEIRQLETMLGWDCSNWLED